MVGRPQAQFLQPLCPQVPGQRVVNEEQRHKDRPSSYFWESNISKEVNRRKGDSLPAHWVHVAAVPVAHQVLPSLHTVYTLDFLLLSASPNPNHCLQITFICMQGHTHAHCHSLVVAVPVQFNVVQIGCMCNDVSVLLYQFRISGQLFLKERKVRKVRVRKGSQQLLDAEWQAFFPSQILSQLRKTPQAFKPLLVLSFSSIFHNHLPG